MWTASLGLPAFDKARARELADAVEAWRDTAIEPLRAVRTALRGGVAHAPEDETEALRKQVLKLEIEAERVEQVIICTPDKDLAQCVTADGRVVQYDRRRELLYDRDGVIEKFGVPPESIPDYLGLVGDSADGFPGLPGWGAKSSSAVLARYEHLENIPAAPGQWDVPSLRGAAKLAATLQAQFDDALLFRQIATLDYDVEVGSVDDWQWGGPTADFATICGELDNPELLAYAERLAR